MNKKAKRIQFDFTPDAFESLNKLTYDTGAASKAEVVRNALLLYEFVTSKLREGYILNFEKNGVTQEVKLLIPM